MNMFALTYTVGTEDNVLTPSDHVTEVQAVARLAQLMTDGENLIGFTVRRVELPKGKA